MLRAVSETIARTFDFGGTTNRRDYWSYFVFYVVATLALLIVAEVQPDGSSGRAVATATATLLYLPVLAATVRRLHDVGRSGAWAWLLIFSFVGFLLLLVFTTRRDGDVKIEWPARSIHLGGKGLVLAVALLAFSRALWEPFYIPSGSMKPALLIGDYLVVPLNGAAEIDRGDVVAFQHPVIDQVFVARIIGLSGDTVQMRKGQVFLGESTDSLSGLPQEPNGEFVELYERQGPFGTLPHCRERGPREGDPCTATILTERLPNGRAYQVLNVREGARFDDTAAQTVPDDQLFLLGDHRDNALDSRMSAAQGGMGFVPMDNIVGRVDRIVFSSAGRFLWNVATWRWDRLWKKVI